MTKNGLLRYPFGNFNLRKLARIAAVKHFTQLRLEWFNNKLKNELEESKQSSSKIPKTQEIERREVDDALIDSMDTILFHFHSHEEFQSAAKSLKLSEAERVLLYEKWDSDGNLELRDTEEEEFDEFIIEFSEWFYDNNASVLIIDISKEFIELFYTVMHQMWDEDYYTLIDNWRGDTKPYFEGGLDYAIACLTTEPIIVRRFPSERVLKYLKESRKTFFTGHEIGTIMQNRSVMEITLQEAKHLAYDNQIMRNEKATNNDNKIKDLINECLEHNIINKELKDKCHDLRCAGNAAAHGNKPRLTAEDSINIVKELIEFLYA